MNQRIRVFQILLLAGALSLGHAVPAEEGDLSGDEINDIFDNVNHSSYGENVASLPSESLDDSTQQTRPERVDDDQDAAEEINGVVGDSLTESNSFQSYTPEPEVTADRFIHGENQGSFKSSADPGSWNYDSSKHKKKTVKKTVKKSSKSTKKIAAKKSKSKSHKKVAKSSKPSSKSKSRKVASAKKGL